MATLQEVSAQLMKPAKDLAEWNFPLAQVLEEYYALLDHPCDLNFGEAALVLQNSANVYVRRVEYLYQEVTALSQSIIDEHQENGLRTEKGPRKSRKTTVDFQNFEFIDLSKEPNKSINLKPSKNEKNLKLLSKRYPQLENISRHKFSLEILDTSGEIIGKKYDFRCNQQLSASKMLVDEVTPSDFHKRVFPEVSEAVEVENENVDNFDSSSDFEDAFRETAVFSPQESAYGSMISNSDANTPTLRVVSDFSQTPRDNSSDPQILSPEPEIIRGDSGMGQELDSSISDTSGQITKNTDICSNEFIHCNKPPRIRKYSDTDAGYTSGDADDVTRTLEPSKKVACRNTRSSSKESTSFKPIPFESLVPEKLPKSRREFKLPCHISLLKYRVKPRRKRVNPNSIAARRAKVKQILEKDSDSNIKDKGELEKDVMDRLKMKSSLENSVDESDVNKDQTLARPNETADNIETSDMAGPDTISPPLEASCSYTPPQSPSSPQMSDTCEQSDVYSQERIERKMQELQKEFDSRNERQEETAKWFEMMETLKKAEERPVFHVHEWEGKILQAVKDREGISMEFECLARQEQPENIARLFVASLHLANRYTVDINIVNENNKDKVSLTLLN